MKVKGVRFVESAWLPESMEEQVIVGRPTLPGDPISIIGRPGTFTPEFIGHTVNRLRDMGYAVEVVSAESPE